jgi:hypothetical protein
MKDGTYRASMNGSGSLELKTLVSMGKGYWVSDDSGVTIEGTLTKQGILDALSLMDIEYGEIVGVWTDTEKEITHIDRSHHFFRKDVAIDLGNLYEQKAIYDCQAKEEIRL